MSTPQQPPARMFPIMGKLVATRLAPIPWAFIAPHEAQAVRNHSQTLERLAERGGLGANEALLVVLGKPLSWPMPDFDAADRQLRALVIEWESRHHV